MTICRSCCDIKDILEFYKELKPNTGIKPMTSILQVWRSITELIRQQKNYRLFRVSRQGPLDSQGPFQITLDVLVHLLSKMISNKIRLVS